MRLRREMILMTKYIGKKVLWAVVVILVISFVVFVLFDNIPYTMSGCLIGGGCCD